MTYVERGPRMWPQRVAPARLASPSEVADFESPLRVPEVEAGRHRGAPQAVPEAARGSHPATDLKEVATNAGLSRIDIVEWRDLKHPEAGGSELHAARIAERWAEAGIEVVVRASRAPGAARRSTYDGYCVERPAGRYAVFPKVAAGALRRASSGPDGMVEVWNGMPFLSPLWSRGPRMVFIHHVHDGMWDLVLPAPLARVGKGIERWAAPPLYRRTPIVTLSESARRTIVELLRLPPEHVSVVPPGIDERFSPGVARSADPLVVAVGRLVGYKQFDTLIEVLARLRHRVPTLRAVIAGEGTERLRLQHRINELGASSWLELTGRVSDDRLLHLYRRAWVLASTSAFEGWGMTITEAARCATPAVASRIPGHLDAVHDGVTGLLAASPAEMEQGLAAVLTDGDLRRRLGAAAEAWARRLTWDRTALGTLEVLATDALRRQCESRRR